MHALDSPFVVPLGAFLVAIVAIISATIGKAYAQRTRAEQRIALLAQGVPLTEVERILQPGSGSADPAQARFPSNPIRSAAAIRRTGIILISSGIGIAAFFVALAPIVHDSEVYSGATVGLVPFFIGIGFLVDYRMLMRDLTRFREELSH